jgi:peroxiredoxin
MSARPTPRQAVPPLEVPTLDGETFAIGAARPRTFTLIVMYRGLHCPYCKAYLTELDRLVPEFAQRGVETIAISADPEVRARQAREDWGLERVRVGYALPIGTARAWGLYVSAARGGSKEPALFSEPGIFLVKPDASLFWAAVSTMPFARPHFDEILGAIDFVLSRGYPARGEA